MRLATFACVLLLLISGSIEGADAPAKSVRIATFNIQELTAKKLAEVDDRGQGKNPQLLKAAEILQRVRPDIVLINEIDYDGPSETSTTVDHPTAARLFSERYLKIGQHGLQPLDYPHQFYEPVNTGVPTGLDLNNDGRTDGPADAYGFGRYAGEYGMVLFSKFPLESTRARTFRLFRWIDMPGALIPDGKSGKPPFLSAEEVSRFRLSSKSHWDVPIRIGAKEIHLLCSHPTPPVFDGEEDLNGRRNFDEIRLWADYIAGGDRASYVRDDRGSAGGLTPEADFIVLGDLNSDPIKSDATHGKVPIQLLFDLPQITDPRPLKTGLDKPGTAAESTDPARHHTSHFGRLDYVLPSRNLKTVASGIWYPSRGDELFRLVDRPQPASDHSLVWIDLQP